MRRRHPVADAPPFVEPPAAFEHQPLDVERHAHHRLFRQLIVEEFEVTRVPGEDVVDALLGLQPQHLVQILFGDRAHVDQDLAEQLPFRFLARQRLVDLLVRQITVAGKKTAEVLLGVGRGRGQDGAVVEEDLLLDVAVVDHQCAGLLAHGQPLQELGEHHRLEVAGDTHGDAWIIADWAWTAVAARRWRDRSGAGPGGATLPLIMARRARLAVGDLRLLLHADEDQLGDASPGLEHEGLRSQVL